MNVPVLILGETGTGKSMLGSAIHLESPRNSGPYVAVNCAGIPDTLFESEFFGHQRGAFTGAREARRGFLEQAKGGSLFLDEVGELAVSQQVKLLTAIEGREIRRLGSEGTVKVDVRMMAGTSRDLLREVHRGAFRRDLFYRLAVLTCRIPPLRTRREDIPLLAQHLLRVHRERHHRPRAQLSPRAMEYLESHSWPGNVRELSHLLEAALILSEPGPLEPEALESAASMAGSGESDLSHRSGGGKKCLGGGEGLRGEQGGEQGPSGEGDWPSPSEAPLPSSRRYAFQGSEDEEREAIQRALRQARGNKSLAAQKLGMARNTLRQKMTKYDLA